MTLLAFGLNHITAPLELREKVVFGPDILQEALLDLSKQSDVQEAAILSTCNRTEVYCSLNDLDRQQVMDWFLNFHGLSSAEMQPFLYSHPDASAVKHMLRVASGLDSMVLGESQVLGQLKEAYQAGLKSGSIGKLLGQLFQHSFKVAKHVRSNTAIGSHPVSVAYAAVRLAQQIFGDLSKQTALLIGAGETIELVARHLHQAGLQRMIIANRTLERSQNLASEFSAYGITLGDIPQHLEEADIIISSTASQLPILGKGAIETAIIKRKHRPVFIVDIAVPRDVEAEAGELEDVYLYTVDDLKEVIDENMRSRKKAAVQAEEIVETQVLQYMAWLNSLGAVSTIRALRNQANSVQAEELANGIRKLKQGEDPEKILQEVTRSLINKLIHSPSAQLRQSSAEGREDLIQATHELFNLSTQAKSDKKDE
ncbi:MAG: glutamyl-tRNA reductase [Gammaproteobacteria bacterium]|jgi:glutamyl-tRNA reductase